MSKKPKKISKTKQEEINRQLGPLYLRIGGITFFVGLVSLLIGLLIDRANDTTPIFTLAILVISLPLVLLLNTRMLRKKIDEIIAGSENQSENA